MRQPQRSSAGAAMRRRSFRTAWGALCVVVVAGAAACDDPNTENDAPASGGTSATGGLSASGSMNGGGAGHTAGATANGGAPPSAGASGSPSSGGSSGGAAAAGGAAASSGVSGGATTAGHAGSNGQGGAFAEGGAMGGGASGAAGSAGDGGDGGRCSGTATPCVLACNDSTITGVSARCQDGAWTCSQGIPASSCPSCGGIPGAGEVCEERQWVCRPEQKAGFFAACRPTACYSCLGFSGPVEAEGCRCTCTAMVGGDRVLCVRN
jgi:hypothetical protein